jgi:hypothetical protein
VSWILFCCAEPDTDLNDTIIDQSQCHGQTSTQPLLTSHNVMVRPQHSHYWPVTMSWSDLNTAIIDQSQCHGQTSTQPLLTTHMSWLDPNITIIGQLNFMLRTKIDHYWPVTSNRLFRKLWSTSCIKSNF